MHWLYSEFRLYCERKKIKILRDDMRYIENRLLYIPKDEHRRVMRDYVRIWIKAIEDGFSDNDGRKMANEYLLGK
jgi:hypothetical protein